MKADFDSLAAAVKNAYPGDEVDVISYPNGGVFLEVKRHNILYQVEFLPRYSCFGVSRVADESRPFGSHDLRLETFDAAKSKFLELLSGG